MTPRQEARPRRTPNPPPTPQICARSYFHGTAKREAAVSILRRGILPKSILFADVPVRRGRFVPVRGAVYLSADARLATTHAIGADMIGSPSPAWLIEKHGAHGYLFEVRGADLCDVDPDEDAVGHAVYFARRVLDGRETEVSPHSTWPELDASLLSDRPFAERLMRFAERAMTRKQLHDIRFGFASQEAAGGKRALRSMSDEMKIALVEHGASVAHAGPIRPSRAWRIDRRRTAELRRDGSDILTVASPWSLPKRVANPPRRSSAERLPTWLKGSADPLRDYFEEMTFAPNERVLEALFAVQSAVDATFWHRKVSFPTGASLHLSGGRGGDFVYEPEASKKRAPAWGRSDAVDFLDERSMMGDLQRYYGDKESEFNAEFWADPVPTLFHGTRDLRGVLRVGIEPRNETRGIGNRSVGLAVFSTTESSVAGTYARGDDGGVVRVNAAAMKRDGLTPFVGQEPEVLENELLASMAHRLGVEREYETSDSGIDRDTVIVYGHVPAKYLRPLRPGGRSGR